uniref:DNA methyltransferase n=1 Tax=Chryseobacterium sp. TaxID=1871047 RepID=UPI001599898C|nr:site-specific DNA-methyltransferase [Chryseobacterium sp.]QJS06476.1 type III restriction endonuclease subunit M, site-specific DNA-methyltransferase [Chryseobacterium sp.]
MQLYNHIKSILEQNEDFYKDGKIFKNKVVEAALKLDPTILSLLLKDKTAKKTFFQEVEGILVFDKVKFQKFVSNKEFLPDSFTAFKNKIGLTANGEYLTEAKEVVLDFPFKDCVLEGGQTKEDQKRQEIFWNETLAPDEIDRMFEPKVLTDWKRYDNAGIHKVKSITKRDNFIIKGNNLITLHSLKAIFKGVVKLIYIDPPYNTGEDSFRYNDNFNHSTWLTFMKNRIEVARELMASDGFIFIQIDNKEEAYLKVLCDNIFGSENYRNTIITKKGTKSLQKQFKTIKKLNAGFDSILLYSKNESTQLPVLFKQLSEETASSWNNHWRGTDRPTMRYEIFGIHPSSGQWRWEKKRTLKAIKNFEILIEFIKQKNNVEISNEVIDEFYEEYLQLHNISEASEFEMVRLSKNNKPEHYIPPQNKILLSENWMDLSVAGRVTNFEHEKNEEILKRIIEWVTVEGDLVLDFFLGSGTTAAVAHKLNRQYIGIEQMNYDKTDSTVRLSDAIAGVKKGIPFKGGGSFISASLKNDSSIEKEIDKLVDASICCNDFENFIRKTKIKYNIQLDKTIDKQEFASLSSVERRALLLDIIDPNIYYIPFAEIDDEDYSIDMEDKKNNHLFYNL